MRLHSYPSAQYGDTPLMDAVGPFSHAEIARLLLEYGASTTAVNVVRIMALVGEGAVAKLLSQRGVTALHKACLEGHLWPVPLLLQHEAIIDAVDAVSVFRCLWVWLIVSKLQFGGTPLHCAAMAGHTRVVAQLLDNGASIDVEERVRVFWRVFAVLF